MKLLVRIVAAAAGIGAAVGAVLWAKKNLTVDVSKEPETPEEKAELDEIEAEAAQKTEEELKDAEGNALKTALARAKGWVRSHVYVKVTPPEEPAEEEPTEEGAEKPADAETAEEPAAPEAAEAPAAEDEDSKLNASALADPESIEG